MIEAGFFGKDNARKSGTAAGDEEEQRRGGLTVRRETTGSGSARAEEGIRGHVILEITRSSSQHWPEAS